MGTPDKAGSGDQSRLPTAHLPHSEQAGAMESYGVVSTLAAAAVGAAEAQRLFEHEVQRWIKKRWHSRLRRLPTHSTAG